MSKTPKLTIVPTPIGNLGDITLRAIETLKSVDIVYAEDTRKTLSLLNHLEIKKKIKSYHKDNESSSAIKIIEDVNNDKTIALVSDAGMPCISDPGNTLVTELIQNLIPFEVLPGATAFIPALLYSGFQTESFYFAGFLPNRGSKKTTAIESYTSLKTTLVFYESPHRIKDTVKQMLHIYQTQISVSRELTKIYDETVLITSEADIDAIKEKGEFVIVVDNNQNEDTQKSPSEFTEIATNLIKEGIKGKDALKVLKILGLKRNDAYQLLEDIANSKT